MGRSRKNKRSTNRRKTSKHKHNSSEDDAGQAIAAGGFGCVFKPAIACKDSSINEKMKKSGYEYVTKVMIARYAREEMEEVNKVLPIVKKIPNNKRYFLLDGIFECKNFGPLNTEDLKGFNSKCNNLRRAGIDSSNVNRKLSALSAMYIPFGGESVAKIMRSLSGMHQNSSSSSIQKKIGLIVWALADVLENAVVPMNKLGLVHLDLKGDNMLLNLDVVDSGKMPYIKIIDWGLAGIVPAQNVASAAQNRPLQFNAPFSNILFNKELVNIITAGDCYGGEITEAQINTLATQIVVKMVKDWAGHAAYISHDLKLFTSPYAKSKGMINELDSKADCTTEAITVIVEYIAAILRKYMKRKSNGLMECSFDSKAYFQEVYRYNCDVWGLLTSFQNFIGEYNSYSKFRGSTIVRGMSNIMYKYCFAPTYAAEKIPINEVIKDMHKLGGICGIVRQPPVENITINNAKPPQVAPPRPPPKEAAIATKKKTKLILRADTGKLKIGTTISLKGKRDVKGLLKTSIQAW